MKLARMTLINALLAKPVARRQEMVIGTLALLRGLFIVAFEISRASGPKGEEVL